jgi:hypothetical protein
MSNINEFICNNNLIYTYIWYYINGEGKKVPINEYNSLEKDKCVETMNRQNNNLKKIMIKPKDYEIKKKRIILNEEEYNSLVLCHSIFLKHCEEIYVIDIDDKNIRRLEDLPLLEYNILKDCHYTLGNTKGIHIYIKIKEMINYKNQQKVMINVDGDLIRKNNIWEGVDKEIYGNKNNLIKEIEWSELSIIFDKKKMNIIESIDNKSDKTEIIKYEKSDTLCSRENFVRYYEKSEIESVSDISDTSERKNENKIDINKFKKYLDGISERRSDEYLYWTQTIWIIHNVYKANNWSLKIRNEMIHEFSKRSSKYEESIVDNFIENNIRENGVIGVGTLILWYKEDNNIKKLEESEIIIDYSERGMGELFLKLKKDIIIYQEGKMYIYYKNEWYNDEKCELSRYIITETLIDYLINEKKEIDKELNNILKYKYDEEKINKLKEVHTDIIYYIKKLKTIKFIGEILKQIQILKSCELKRVEFDLGDDQKYNIHFKNGVYDIKKREFRKRCYEDYITQYLDYDYIEYEKIDIEIHNFVEDFFKKIQPDEVERRFTLSYLAYSITGNTGAQVFKVNIGYLASNGKSTEVKIHERCFPIYTCKLNKETFDKNNGKRHKYIYKCLHNPVRLCYIEELDKSILDGDFLKDWVDGNKISNEILYGTCEERGLQAKLMTFSNKDFSIDGDEGIYRRGKVQFYDSKFEDNIEDDYKNHRYKKILNFESNFEKEEYKNAYFHFLLKYVDKLEIPKNAEKIFKDIVDENDNLKSEVEEYFIITRDENDKISKKIVEEILNNYNFKEILSKLKSMGVKYNKDLRLDGEKKIFIGLKKILKK